jgi:hypothetical protein
MIHWRGGGSDVRSRDSQEALQRVWEAFSLQEAAVGNGSGCPYNGVTGAHKGHRVGIDRPHPFLQLAGEAVVQAFEVSLPGFAQIQV